MLLLYITHTLVQGKEAELPAADKLYLSLLIRLVFLSVPQHWCLCVKSVLCPLCFRCNSATYHLLITLALCFLIFHT